MECRHTLAEQLLRFSQGSNFGPMSLVLLDQSRSSAGSAMGINFRCCNIVCANQFYSGRKRQTKTATFFSFPAAQSVQFPQQPHLEPRQSEAKLGTCRDLGGISPRRRPQNINKICMQKDPENANNGIKGFSGRALRGFGQPHQRQA